MVACCGCRSPNKKYRLTQRAALSQVWWIGSTTARKEARNSSGTRTVSSCTSQASIPRNKSVCNISLSSFYFFFLSIETHLPSFPLFSALFDLTFLLFRAQRSRSFRVILTMFSTCPLVGKSGAREARRRCQQLTVS